MMRELKQQMAECEQRGKEQAVEMEGNKIEWERTLMDKDIARREAEN